MGLLLFPLILYPIALAAMHIPMMVVYFILKRLRLLSLWHFMIACAAVFGPAHWLYFALIVGPGTGPIPFLFGLILGVVCGATWWYILVKRIGTGLSNPRIASTDGSSDSASTM